MHAASTRVDSHSLSESNVPLKRDVKDGQTMIGTCRVADTNRPNKRNKKRTSLPFCQVVNRHFAWQVAIGNLSLHPIQSSRRERNTPVAP